MVRLGRPLKYQALLLKLEPDVIYSPASIADCALHFGHVCANDPDSGKILSRIRNSCGYISKHYEFPAQGDGTVYREGQRPLPGWLGSRWMEAVKKHKRCIRNKRLKIARKAARRKCPRGRKPQELSR